MVDYGDSMDRNQLIALLDELLQPQEYQDYAPNGLQVEGRREIRRIVTAVTASARAIQQAIDYDADMLLVHHGYFWRGEDPRVIGMRYRRLQRLLRQEINLVAYHLPLDGHPALGNNAQWGQRLGVEVEGHLPHAALVCTTTLEHAMTSEELCRRAAAAVEGREPLLISGHQRPIRTIGWCSGAAQNYLSQAAEAGLDAYLSGEVSEQNYHEAMELGICYLACGHHATERGGVMALGAWIERELGLACHFADEPNPV